MWHKQEILGEFPHIPSLSSCGGWPGGSGSAHVNTNKAAGQDGVVSVPRQCHGTVEGKHVSQSCNSTTFAGKEVARF